MGIRLLTKEERKGRKAELKRISEESRRSLLRDLSRHPDKINEIHIVDFSDQPVWASILASLIVTVPNALILRFGFLLAGCEITKRADYTTSAAYAAHFWEHADVNYFFALVPLFSFFTLLLPLIPSRRKLRQNAYVKGQRIVNGPTKKNIINSGLLFMAYFGLPFIASYAVGCLDDMSTSTYTSQIEDQFLVFVLILLCLGLWFTTFLLIVAFSDHIKIKSPARLMLATIVVNVITVFAFYPGFIIMIGYYLGFAFIIALHLVAFYFVLLFISDLNPSILLMAFWW
jgi:hypothetical protein